jgi:hypothetical protein
VAISYNRFRFKDPYSLATIREQLGIERFPAVSDEDLARAVGNYQHAHGETVDGRAGPTTTRHLTTDLRGGGSDRDATLLEQDNYVSWSDTIAPTHNPCGTGADRNGDAQWFVWDVTFNTSLRGGWIIQEIRNVFNVNACAGQPAPGGWRPTPRYWEAWYVTDTGEVRLPRAISADRTRATSSESIPRVHDMWRRPQPAGFSSGNWSMRATLHTRKTLPAGFARRGVNDAGDLFATAAHPGEDNLGPSQAGRSATGTFRCCPTGIQSHTA